MFCIHEKRKWNILYKKRIPWLLSSIFSLFFSGLLIISIGWHKDYQNIPKEHLVGNKASNVNRLKGNGFPFSFLVIGDTQCSHRAKVLIERAFKEGNSSFMVILGDFVRKPDIWNHRFFLSEMTAEIKPPFPVFLVSGNHDIDYESPRNQQKQRVTPEVYESLYGARNFDFTFNQCLFIICGIDPKNQTSYLSYLRDTLSKKGEGKRHIFVFLHIPPVRWDSHIGTFIPNEGEFFSLLETYKVTTCFFGDIHRYWRGQTKGVNLIVSGGGGRLKKSESEWGKFHHILKMTVDEYMIVEDLMTIQDQVNYKHSFKKWVLTFLFPIIGNKGWTLYALAILFLSWGIYSVIMLAIFNNSVKIKDLKGVEDSE